jgi:hypothetical protein
MTKEEITAWALANGWQMLGGHPSLTKPNRPKEAIVRLVLLATVVNLEVKKPAGKWEKVAGGAYAKVLADEDTGVPGGLGFETIPSFSMLMRENKDRMVFAAMTGKHPD